MIRPEIQRYSVTDIMTHACPGKLCHEHDVEELEAYCTKLEKQNKEAVELFRELRVFVSIAHRSLVMNDDLAFAAKATELDILVLNLIEKATNENT